MWNYIEKANDELGKSSLKRWVRSDDYYIEEKSDGWYAYRPDGSALTIAPYAEDEYTKQYVDRTVPYNEALKLWEKVAEDRWNRGDGFAVVRLADKWSVQQPNKTFVRSTEVASRPREFPNVDAAKSYVDYMFKLNALPIEGIRS